MVYTEEQLKKYSIYQLRFVARNAGVRAPTTKKRNDLIQSVMAIQTGKEKPYYPANSKGRPAKSCFLPLESDKSIVYGVENGEPLEKVDFNKDIQYYNKNQIVKVEGFVVENNFQYFVVILDETMGVSRVAHLSKEYIEVHGIREGCKLVCETQYNAEVEMLNVINVLKVDDLPFTGEKRKSFEKKKTIFTKKAIDINCPSDAVKEIKKVASLCYGDRALIVGDKRGRLDAITLPLATNMPSNVKTVVVALNQTPKRIAELKQASKDKFELFTTTFSDSLTAQYFVLKIAINYVKRLAECGVHVGLVLVDLEDIYPDKMDMEALYSLKSFFAMARKFADAGSCTVIGGCTQSFIDEHKDFKNFTDVMLFENDKKFDAQKSGRQDI